MKKFMEVMEFTPPQTTFDWVCAGICVVLLIMVFAFFFLAIRATIRSDKEIGGTKSVSKKTPKIMLGELKTALVKTLRNRDQKKQPDKAFRASYSLVAESEEFGVVVLREDTNNYGYQMRTGDWSDSNAWENLVVATRKGYCFLGRVNLYKDAGYKGPFQITKSEIGSVVVSWNNGIFPISDEDMKGGYDYPFEMPPHSEITRTSYNLDGIIVVIDDDPDQGEYVQSSVNRMGDSLKASCTVWDLPGCVRRVDDAIQCMPSCSGCTDRVKLVLVDGNFSGDGRGFNAGRLIPALRKQYPNAILFANSGKGEDHANYNRDLLRAGCDCSLPDEDYGYKSDLPKILARVAEIRPEILVKEELDLNEVLKI
jgi:hypothetical protein